MNIKGVVNASVKYYILVCVAILLIISWIALGVVLNYTIDDNKDTTSSPTTSSPTTSPPTTSTQLIDEYTIDLIVEGAIDSLEDIDIDSTMIESTVRTTTDTFGWRRGLPYSGNITIQDTDQPGGIITAVATAVVSLANPPSTKTPTEVANDIISHIKDDDSFSFKNLICGHDVTYGQSPTPSSLPTPTPASIVNPCSCLPEDEGSPNAKCQTNTVNNYCDIYDTDFLSGLIGRDDNILSSKNDFCNSPDIYTDSNTWCGTKEWSIYDESRVTLRDNIKRHCCDKVEVVSNFNFIGFILYILTTGVIILIIVTKLFKSINKFKKEDNGLKELLTEEDNGFKELFTKVASFKSILATILVIYVLVIPGLRYILLSFKCSSDTSGGLCNKPCVTTDDCNSLHGVCGYCINNICTKLTEDSLRLDGDDFHLNKVSLTICPENLSNDHYGEYNGKFLPRQIIHVNDTLSSVSDTSSVDSGGPFVAGLPIPSYTKNDNEYMVDTKFNNFIQLNTYNAEVGDGPSLTSCGVGGRLQLPEIDGPLEGQNLDNENVLHNKVYREGPDVGENSWPCSDIVIPIESKNILKNKLDLGIHDIDSIGDTQFNNIWANEFELNRIECAEQHGQCYMKNYPCETSNGTPIPLKYIESGIPYLTIGSLSNPGCQNAVYPCSEEALDQSCTSLELSGEPDNYLIEVEHGGICKKVVWETNRWIEVNASSELGEYKCFPTNPETPVDVSLPHFTGATLADWVSNWDPDTNNNITSQCSHVGRFPSNSFEFNRPVENDDNSVIFRWFAKPDSEYALCSELPENTCVSGTTLKSGFNTYNVSSDGISECCYNTTSLGLAGGLDIEFNGTPEIDISHITINDNTYSN